MRSNLLNYMLNENTCFVLEKAQRYSAARDFGPIVEELNSWSDTDLLHAASEYHGTKVIMAMTHADCDAAEVLKKRLFLLDACGKLESIKYRLKRLLLNELLPEDQRIA